MIIPNLHGYFFLTHKNDAFHSFSKFVLKVQNEKGYILSFTLKLIMEDNLIIKFFSNFCDKNNF